MSTYEAGANEAQRSEEPGSAAGLCPACNGNDGSAPCLYPSEGKQGCLRDARLDKKRILVVGAGKRSVAIAAALIAAGADVVQANELPITRKPEITRAWLDELTPLGCVDDKRQAHGPQQKYRSGKVRR